MWGDLGPRKSEFCENLISILAAKESTWYLQKLEWNGHILVHKNDK